jgi:hypothetical protein
MELQWSLLHHRSSACLATISRLFPGSCLVRRRDVCSADKIGRPDLSCAAAHDIGLASARVLAEQLLIQATTTTRGRVSQQGRHCGGHVPLLGRTQHRRHLTCMCTPFISSHYIVSSQCPPNPSIDEIHMRGSAAAAPSR